MNSLKLQITGDEVVLGTVVFNPQMAILAEQAGFEATPFEILALTTVCCVVKRSRREARTC